MTLFTFASKHTCHATSIARNSCISDERLRARGHDASVLKAGRNIGLSRKNASKKVSLIIIHLGVDLELGLSIRNVAI
jgi:hypothetical protein